MNSLKSYPLGASFCDSPHSVIRCLPTMADVIDYEEHEPRVMEALPAGYPRFVVHTYIKQLLEFYLEREGLVGRAGVLVPSRRASEDARSRFGTGVVVQTVEDALYLVHVDGSDAALVRRLRKFVQHVGCGISSRQAEDLLVHYGQLAEVYAEVRYTGNARARVEAELAEQIACPKADVLVCASGMNAFYAGYRAVEELQRSRGRTAWLQLGWLYLDSGVILKEYLGAEQTLEICYAVADVAAIEEKIRAYGETLAAVVVECPSNPLIQMCDLERLAAVVRAAGGVLLVDPSVASMYCVDVLPYADLLVTSLTKYAAIEGDVMAGALALNRESPLYGDLVQRVSAYHTPAYERDLSRLAHEMQQAPEWVTQIIENAEQLYRYLNTHAAVKRVHYAADSDSAKTLSKATGGVGAVLSIELKGSMPAFYDAVQMMKGPSFGTRFSLLSPFMYLAHYDLVTSEVGRAELRSAGIAPELIRISVGAEPYVEIEAAIAAGLEASLQA